MNFEISVGPIKEKSLGRSLDNHQIGAVVTFEGRVREINHGRHVTYLDYEAFGPLCQTEGLKIMEEAKTKFSVEDIYCVHRIGKVNPGEVVIWIKVLAQHRSDAFSACRYVMDEIKTRLPIWKKEHYEDREAVWINAPQEGASRKKSSLSEENFYQGQMNLPQIGPEGQKRLRNSKVLIVGAGGLGSPALLYLASCGIGTIGICEADKLEESNLHRQIVYEHKDIGRDKVTLAAERLKKLNPYISIIPHNERLNVENVAKLIKSYDVLIDCSDNFLTKFLLQDAAFLFQKPLIMASVYQFEGQMLTFYPGESISCLRCLWPKIPDTCAGVCSLTGILGVVPGALGVLQTTEAIKYILGIKKECLHDAMLIVDLKNYRMTKVHIPKDPACPLCSTHPRITHIEERHYQVSFPKEGILSLNDISKDEILSFEWIDVREEYEVKTIPIIDIPVKNIPFSQFNETRQSFSDGRKYLLFCSQGVRSMILTQRLREKGFSNIFSLREGAVALQEYLQKSIIR